MDFRVDSFVSRVVDQDGVERDLIEYCEHDGGCVGEEVSKDRFGKRKV